MPWARRADGIIDLTSCKGITHDAGLISQGKVNPEIGKQGWWQASCKVGKQKQQGRLKLTRIASEAGTS